LLGLGTHCCHYLFLLLKWFLHKFPPSFRENFPSVRKLDEYWMRRRVEGMLCTCWICSEILRRFAGWLSCTKTKQLFSSFFSMAALAETNCLCKHCFCRIGWYLTPILTDPTLCRVVEVTRIFTCRWLDAFRIIGVVHVELCITPVFHTQSYKHQENGKDWGQDVCYPITQQE
jgi:hypothetical protein